MKEKFPKFNINGETPEELEKIGNMIDAQNEDRAWQGMHETVEQAILFWAQKSAQLEIAIDALYAREDEIDKWLREEDTKPSDFKLPKTAEDDLDDTLAYERMYEESQKVASQIRRLSREQHIINEQVNDFDDYSKKLFLKLKQSYQRQIESPVSPKDN